MLFVLGLSPHWAQEDKMRKLFLVMIFGLISTFIYAAPFGLKMGMTVEEIAEQCEEEPSYFEDDIYFVKPIKKHPLFDYYAVYVNEKTGLYQIRAISSPITTNKFGTELKNAFNSLKDRIAKTYGKPKVTDKYSNSSYSYYQQDEYWFYSLREGSRELSAVWGYDSALSDDLESVALECTVLSGFDEGTGQLVLYYYFKNTSAVEDEQDEVF